MIDLLVFILLICLMAYLYNYPTSQSNNAATTILQIWTGNCNLSCRQSGYSRFSGMSGLNLPPPPRSPEIPAGGETPVNMVQQNVTNTASNCACQPCPCGVIENIIRTCRPATEMYEENMESLGFYLASGYEMISDTCEKFTNAMQCGTSCQRHAEYVNTLRDFSLESSGNVTFDREKTERKRSKTVFPKISEMLHQKARSENTLKGKSDTAVVKEMSATMKKVEEAPKPAQNISQANTALVNEMSATMKKDEETTKPTQNISQAITDTAGPSQKTDACPTAQLKTDQMPECGTCPRCVADGKICISQCPKARNN